MRIQEDFPENIDREAKRACREAVQKPGELTLGQSEPTQS